MNLHEELQLFRKILVVCPCCNEIKRLSELKLRVKGAPMKTWLDNYESKIRVQEKKEETFKEKADKLREKHVEAGRKQAAKKFNEAISPGLKKLKIDPYDLKAIMHPVDFVAFNGWEKNKVVHDVSFITHSTTNNSLKQLHEQVKKAVADKAYDWQVARFGDDNKLVLE